MLDFQHESSILQGICEAKLMSRWFYIKKSKWFLNMSVVEDEKCTFYLYEVEIYDNDM